MSASAPKSSNSRVQAHRARMRAKGLRPVTMWVIDTRLPEVREQIRRECAIIVEAERSSQDEREVIAMLDAHWNELSADFAPYDWGKEGPPS